MSLPAISAENLRFVEEYTKDRNTTRAALAAGISTDYQSAAELGRRLLKKVEIRAWVRHVWRTQARRLKTAVPDVVREWAILGKSDLTDYVLDPDGRVTTAPGVPRAALRAVKKVKVTRTERLKDDVLTVETRAEIELHGKDGPLKSLYEHLHGVLPGEDKTGHVTELAATLSALLAARQPQPSGSGQPPGPAEGEPAVDPEPGAAG